RPAPEMESNPEPIVDRLELERQLAEERTARAELDRRQADELNRRLTDESLRAGADLAGRCAAKRTVTGEANAKLTALAESFARFDRGLPLKAGELPITGQLEALLGELPSHAVGAKVKTADLADVPMIH